MKRIAFVSIIIFSILLTGCWDMIDISNRIFPYTVGYDLNNEDGDKFKIAFTYPNLNALGKNASSDEMVYLASTSANSIFQAMHKLATELQYPMYLKHLKVVALSEEVLREDDLIKEIIDGINRDFIANKNAQLMAVKESTEDLLVQAVEAKNQQVVGGALYTLLLNEQKSNHFTPITLGNLIEEMDINGAAVIPLAHVKNESIAVEGGAVLKEYGLIGYLDGMENRDLSLLTNKLKDIGVDFDYEGSNLSLMITETKTKRKLVERGENLKVRLEVLMEGHIHSYTLEEGREIDSEEVLEDMQKQAADMEKKHLEKTIEKVQKELKVDLLGIGDYIGKFHPGFWKEIEKDWERIYPEIEIEVAVKVEIRRRGFTK